MQPPASLEGLAYSWLINSFVNGESPVSAAAFVAGHVILPCLPHPASPLLGLWGQLWASCSHGVVGAGTAAPSPVFRGSSARLACPDGELPLAGRRARLGVFTGGGRGPSLPRAGGGG